MSDSTPVNPSPILTHLNELRGRLKIAIIAYLTGVMVLMNFSGTVFDFIASPLLAALPAGPLLVFRNATAVFYT